ncbi:MAG: aminopeptidase P family protein [Candidatus Eremiobacteraeota bacterium]|nr:aminopeptidase P family protein [Candidatus Eremiobacteraeota bacterium]
MDTRKSTDSPDRTKAGHDTPDMPEALLNFMSRDWMEAPITVATVPHLENFQERRKRLSAAYPGAHLVIPAGVEKVRANDTNFRFRPSSDFAYLMGGGEPGALLVLAPNGNGHESVLFVPPHNRGSAEFFTDRAYGELWVGRHRGVDESQIYYGVDKCRPLAQIEPYLEELRARSSDVRTVDPISGDAQLATHLSEMRLIKDAIEVAELRTCCEVSKRAFEDVIRILPTATSEREIEAAFWSRARIEANDVGYLTIAAAGQHACTLHWNHNHGRITKGDLLLLDAGVEVESLYTADITRTMPINGSFSPEQRAVYDIVYAAQQAAFDAVKPGNDFLDPNRAAMRVLCEGLIKLGVLTMPLEEALDPQHQYYRRYTLHNVSHMLGIDVHDCAAARAETYRYGALKTGMVLTVEPGLYFQPDDATVPERLRGIGVRIEDDVLVTESGCDNLSAILPSQADAVEAWMRELTT